jgi:hypothetical protein
MEWTMSFLSEQHILVMETQGVADEAGSLEMTKVIPKAMMEHRTKRCLIDHSAIGSFSGQVVNIYYRPQELRGAGIPPGIKIAEVVLPAHRKHFDFLETVCRNQGFDFRIFNDRESAFQWLAN